MAFINTAEKQAILNKAFIAMNDPNKKFIIFDGLIGAGKTTLIARLSEMMNARGLRTHAIYEPVDIWNSTGALQYFYSDISANCYEFQTFTYISRIERILNEINANSDAEIFLLERSIWTDRYIFVEMLKPQFNAVQLAMYNQWCNLWMFLMPLKPYKWVFLDTSLDETMRRVNIRSRDGETSVSVDYQTALYAKHVEFYKMLESSDCTTLIIPPIIMNRDFKTDDGVLKEIMNLVVG